MCAAQPVWKACLQCGHKKRDMTPALVGSMAVKQIGQATSSAVAVGGWQVAWRRCGGVEGAGKGTLLGLVFAADLGAGGEVAWMSSAGVVTSMVSSGGKDMTHARRKIQKTENGGIQRISEKSTAGFRFLWWVARAHFFFCDFFSWFEPVFFVGMGCGLPVSQEEKCYTTGRSAFRSGENKAVFILASLQICQWRSGINVVPGSTGSKVHTTR